MIRQTTDPMTFVAMTDDELRDAYERTSGEVGDQVADRLAQELERRGIDV